MRARAEEGGLEIVRTHRFWDDALVKWRQVAIQLCCSLKYKDIYLKGYTTVLQLHFGLTGYFRFR